MRNIRWLSQGTRPGRGDAEQLAYEVAVAVLRGTV